MRILIVEDEKRLAGTLQDLLRRQGYTADVCYDGISGLDNARSDIYDLLVLDAMLPGMDGFALLRQLREVNDAIPDPVMSQKISRLEEVSGKIFDYVKAHPEKLPQIRKFMSYYLPTTLKLLRSYDELSRQGVSGQNITGTMEKVEGMMATIVLAFEKQLDSLFGDQAMDISTDITVLDNMMAREGLTGGDAVHQAAQENPVADPQPELDIRNAGNAQTQPPQAEDSVDAGNGITLEL